MAKKKYHIAPGQKYGDLTVVGPGGRRTSGAQLWECLCTCRRTVHVEAGSLVGRGVCRHPQVWIDDNGVSYIMIGEHRCVIDTADVPLVSSYRFYLHRRSQREQAARRTNKVYVCCGNRRTPMQRLILSDQLTPDRPHVDHKDGDPFNNRRYNLRPASTADNAANCDRATHRNKYGYHGVKQVASGRWSAYIMHNYRYIHLGTFASPHDAARAYNAAAIKYHGEFARLNTIREDLD